MNPVVVLPPSPKSKSELFAELRTDLTTRGFNCVEYDMDTLSACDRDWVAGDRPVSEPGGKSMDDDCGRDTAS